MENVTFVSNSHQRPAADNLQKLKSLLTNTQQQIKSQTQQVTIKNLYVSSFTLVCFRSGKLTISNNHDTIYCDEPGMLVLKKEQVVNVTLEEVNGHMDFDILEIPTQRLGALYALIPNEQQTKMAVPTEKAQKIFYTPDFPARREVFEHLKTAFSCTKDTSKGCSNCNNKSCIENEELIPYFLLFLLTAFLRLPESYEIILSSAQITLKERVYNIISSSPSRQWKLTDVADHRFMSTSTLKRKLAEEGTSFSDIYLSARMNQAAKLLRIGNHNVNAVALKCGYDSTSYFIQCFKKYFKTTPSTFIKMANH
ncbi:transcriptional regulator HilD [Salmonella enterica]